MDPKPYTGMEEKEEAASLHVGWAGPELMVMLLEAVYGAKMTGLRH